MSAGYAGLDTNLRRLTGNILLPALRANCVRPNSLPANWSRLCRFKPSPFPNENGPLMGAIFHLVAGAR
jgi:hypothetical protein